MGASFRALPRLCFRAGARSPCGYEVGDRESRDTSIRWRQRPRPLACSGSRESGQKPAWLLERGGFEPSSPVNSRYLSDLTSISIPRRKSSLRQDSVSGQEFPTVQVRLETGFCREQSNVCVRLRGSRAVMSRSLSEREREKLAGEITRLQLLDAEQLKVRWRTLCATEAPPRFSHDLLMLAVAYGLQERAARRA